jgi:hypothetical protein
MQMSAKYLLDRWESLETGDGLRRAQLLARALRISGLATGILAGAGVAVGFPSWIIALAAVATGWTIAEANALQLRIAQWPIFKQYIDWGSVRAAAQGSNG